EEAKRMAQWLRAHCSSVDAVLSSPLERAHKTAEIISHAFSLPAPVQITDAQEVMMGSLQGLTVKQAQAEHQELVDLPLQELFQFSDYGGESSSAIGDRIERLLSTLDQVHEKGARRLILVSHGVFGSHLIKRVICSEEPRSCGVFLSNCTATLLRFQPGLLTRAQLIWHVNEDLTGAFVGLEGATRDI
ncbi:MAG: histidine phosphatase family protein, partial [Polyangiaceae bacterium]|nr:histidine phosphatase family protein [Polyangiaceae bacterium]